MTTKTTDRSDSPIEANKTKQDSAIDRTSLAPPYIQLANILRDQIGDGTYPPGARLPSESELCKQYHVSHMTVRRTINFLSDQGVAVAVQGRGTFVKEVVISAGTFQLQELYNLFKDSDKAKIKLIEVRLVKTDEHVAGKLGLSRGDRAIFLKRLLLHQGDPVLYHEEYLVSDPRQPIVEAEMEVTALYGLFTGSGKSDLKRGELTIEAVQLEKDAAALLNVSDGHAAFCIEHLFYSFDEKPVSWGRFICRRDRLKFTATVGIERM